MFHTLLHISLLATILSDSSSNSLNELDSMFRFRTEPQIYSRSNGIRNNFMYSATKGAKYDLNLYCYKYHNEHDSTLVYSKRIKCFKVKSGSNNVQIEIKRSDTDAFINPDYNEALFSNHYYPEGTYHLVTVIRSKVSLDTISSTYSFYKDTMLDSKSAFYKKCVGQSGLNGRVNIKVPIRRTADYHIFKAAKSNRLTVIKSEADQKIRYDLYSSSLFLGRIITDLKGTIDKRSYSSKVQQRFNEERSTLMSEFKEEANIEDDSRKVEGIISTTSSFNTSQDPYTNIDNKYWEVNGMITLPVAKLPIQIEGYYTTQDQSRAIKSSYLKVHYDVSTLKQELMQKVTKYKQKYQQTNSKNIGVSGLYQQSIKGLEHQSDLLKSQIAKQEATITNQAASGVDSIQNEHSNKLNKAEGKLEKMDSIKREIDEKKSKLALITEKITKYNRLLEQNKDCSYFDSALSYKKLEKYPTLDDISYKKLLKESKDFLPDGKFKSAVSGITEFDAGVFSKYESKFTMSGQNMKGIGMGYEIGNCTVNGTIGKTQFIGRDGGIENFTTYSTKLDFSGIAKNDVSVHLYTYTQDIKVMTSNNFINSLELQRPTLNEPQQILSITNKYKPLDWVTIDFELASSANNWSKIDATALKNRSAIDFNAGLAVPKTTYKADIQYERTGEFFENKTMPINLKNSERVSIINSVDVLKSFLTLGLNFNYLSQRQFNQYGRNIKWGVDIATHSHQYPNLSLSYKPYTTFRSFSDTFLTSQRPLFGSVWSTSLKYQLKKDRHRWLFSINWNQCKTVSDSQLIFNSVLQSMVNYSKNSLNVVLIAGTNEQRGASDNVLPNNIKFIQLMLNYKLNKTSRIAAGQDLGWSYFGITKYGTTLSGSYQSTKVPVIMTLSLRSNFFRVQQVSSMQQLLGANVDLTYIIKNKRSTQ